MNKFIFEKSNFEECINGTTPPINGEYFTVKRGYKLRPSTVRRLHEIKAGHKDLNIYMNTIIDKAINHYYEEIFLKQ